MANDLDPIKHHSPDDSPPHWHPQRSQRRSQPMMVPTTTEPKVELQIQHSNPTFADSDQAAEVQRKRDAARTRQRVRFEVMIGASMTTVTGRRLVGGDEVVLGDVANDYHALNFLVSEGVVSEVDPATFAYRVPLGGGRTRFQVDPTRRGSVMGLRGPILPGEWVCAEDFAGQLAQPERVEIPATLRLDGSVVPGTPASPGRPTVTPEQVLKALVERGIVVDHGTAERARK